MYGAAGPQGCAERRRLWGELDRHILPEDQSQCWMAGDFNFVENEQDRVNTAGRESNGENAEELALFRRLCDNHNLGELEQYIATYRHVGMGSHSKLDRAYTNRHVAWQQEVQTFCDPLPLKGWRTQAGLYHLPLRFGQYSPGQRRRAQGAAIPPQVTETADWDERIRKHFLNLTDHVPLGQTVGPMDKLQILKKAMRAAARDIAAERNEKRGLLGKSHVLPSLLAAASAIRRNDLAAAERALRAAGKWEQYQGMLKSYQPPEALRQILGEVHAVAHAEAVREQEFLDNLPGSAPELPARKKRNQRRFDNLLPGTKSGIHTLIDDDGVLITDPEEIDRTLCRYWGKVFAAPLPQGGAKEKLKGWLEELRNELILPEAIPEWKDEAIDQACEYAAKSAPGPDGIPYEAYKSSELARSILKEAARYVRQ